MAEHAAATAEEPQPKRSLLKLGLLVLNVLIFLAGVGSFAWSKFMTPPPAVPAAQGQENPVEHAEGGDAAKGGHGEAPAKKAEAHGSSAKGEAAKGGHGGAAKNEAAKGGHGAAAKGGHGGDAAKGGSGDPMLVPLAPFIVNLSGDNGQRYLRLIAQVEARGEMAKTELESHLPEVRNRLIFLLTSKTFADIGSVQGKYDLQADITKNINETLDGPFIKKTYFTEFIVQ